MSLAQAQLIDLPFSDLYIRLDAPGRAIYKPHKKDNKGLPNLLVPPEYVRDVTLLIDHVKAHLSRQEGALEYGGLRLRIAKQQTADGQQWACLRRINTGAPQLAKLGFPPHIVRYLQMLGRRTGLVLLSGATGQGKTTTAVGLLTEFLTHFGGVGITIEDPVEFMLPQNFGEAGYCFQVEVHDDPHWAEAIKRALRWAPRYILVGEIRTPKAAEQALRAATTGHLVITTVHAGSPEQALHGLIHLAEQQMGSGAHEILSAAITGIIHQTMTTQGPFIRYVFTEDGAGDAIRALIRDGKIGMLNSYIDKQVSRMANLGKET